MKRIVLLLALAICVAIPACSDGDKPADDQSPGSDGRTGVVVDKRYDPAVTKQSRTCASYTTNKNGVRNCTRYTTKTVTTDDADWILVIRWDDGKTEDVDVEQAEYDKYQFGQAYP